MHSRQGIISKAVIESVRRALHNKYEEDKQIKLMLEEFLTEDLTAQEIEITGQAYEEVKQRLSYSALLDGLWQEIEETQELYDQLHVYDSLEEEYSSAKNRLEHEDLPIHKVELEDIDVNEQAATDGRSRAIADASSGVVGVNHEGQDATSPMGALAERATGTMLERANGAMLAREQGAVVARKQGNILTRQDNSILQHTDGSVMARVPGPIAIRPLQSVDVIRNMPIQVGDLQSQNKQDMSLATSSDSTVCLNEKGHIKDEGTDDEVAAFDKDVAEKTKHIDKQQEHKKQNPNVHSDKDSDDETRGELFLKDVLALIGKVETPSISLEELVRNTEWKEFKKLAKEAKKSLKKARKQAKRAAKKGSKDRDHKGDIGSKKVSTSKK